MKRITALFTTVLLLFTLAACGGGSAVANDPSKLTVADFDLYNNGKHVQMPSSPFLITADNDLGFATNRKVHVGDDAKAVAAEYGSVPCDISYEQNGAFLTLDKALMDHFIGEAQPRYYTVSYVLLVVDDTLYNYEEINDAPESDAYTIYHLEFEITDDVVSAILYTVVQMG